MYKPIFKILTVVLVLTMACSTEQDEADGQHAAAPATEKKQVVLDTDQIRAIGLETGHIEVRNLSSGVRANGYIDVPPQNKAVISPFVTGYVREVRMLVGDRVRRGQVIAVLESLEYLEMQENYLDLSNSLEYLKDEYERKKTLQEQNAIARKQYLLARSEYRRADASMRALREKLILLHADLDQLEAGKVNPLLYIRSPINGSITDVMTVIGRHLDPHEEMMEIMNPDHFHLELNVFEKDIMRIEEGQRVFFRIPNLDHERFEGEVFLIGQNLEQEQRYIRVHVHIDDTQRKFKVGMYVTASIAVQDNRVEAVPASAVLAEGEKKYVFVQKAREDSTAVFFRHEVVTGIEDQGLVQLKYHEGIEQGDKIVVRGAFYLMNAFADVGGE